MDWRTILKWILRRMVLKIGSRWNWLGIMASVRFDIRCVELSGSIISMLVLTYKND
jgi:hypothetical protein